MILKIVLFYFYFPWREYCDLEICFIYSHFSCTHCKYVQWNYSSLLYLAQSFSGFPYLQCRMPFGSIFYPVFWCHFFMDFPSFKYCSKVGPFSTVRNRSITLLCSALPLHCCWDNLFAGYGKSRFCKTGMLNQKMYLFYIFLWPMKNSRALNQHRKYM